MRYRLRTLLIVLALGPPLLAVVGCGQTDHPGKEQSNKPPVVSPVKPPAVVTKEMAIDIVRALALQPGETAEFNCKEVPEGFRVSVEWYVLDENGNRGFFPGGLVVYVLSKSGEVLT